MTLKIAFSVDDVAPIEGHGLLRENDNFKYLFRINEEFGAKFTLFVVSNWEGRANILDSGGFVSWLSSFPYFEIANHGLYHYNPRNKTSMEFVDVDEEPGEKMIKISQDIFKKCGVNPNGFKFPGWEHNPKLLNSLTKLGFKYVADHFVGVNIIKMTNGLYRIPYTLSAENLHSFHYKNILIIHTHIAVDKGNKNGWTDELYGDVKNYLKKIIELNKGDVKFVTFSELLE